MSIQKSGTGNQPETKTVSIRLPKVLVSWMDTLVASGIYSARAEIIRDFTRTELQKPPER